MWAEEFAQSRLVTDLLPTANQGRVGATSDTSRLAHTGTAPVHPSLLSDIHGSLPITSIECVLRALVIAVHKHICAERGINLCPVVADVLANVEQWIASYRHITTGFTLAETLNTKGIGCCSERQTQIRGGRTGPRAVHGSKGRKQGKDEDVS